MEQVKFLESALTTSIIITLHDHEGALMKSALAKEVGTSSGTVDRRYKELEELGIIRIEKRGRMKNEGHWVSLTEKGYTVAEHLIAIDRLLQEP